MSTGYTERTGGQRDLQPTSTPKNTSQLSAEALPFRPVKVTKFRDFLQYSDRQRTARSGKNIEALPVTSALPNALHSSQDSSHIFELRKKDGHIKSRSEGKASDEPISRSNYDSYITSSDLASREGDRSLIVPESLYRISTNSGGRQPRGQKAHIESYSSRDLIYKPKSQPDLKFRDTLPVHNSTNSNLRNRNRSQNSAPFHRPLSLMPAIVSPFLHNQSPPTSQSSFNSHASPLLSESFQGNFSGDHTNDIQQHSNYFDQYSTPTPSISASNHPTPQPQPQINPYAQGGNSLGSTTFYQGTGTYPQQVGLALHSWRPWLINISFNTTSMLH